MTTIPHCSIVYSIDMKKKPAKKPIKADKPSKKTKPTKKAAPRTRIKSQPQSISFGRIIIFSSFAVLLLAVIVNFNKTPVTQAVAGASIFRGMYNQTTILLPQIPGAVKYNIYYKATTEANYTNAVRNISANTTSYTISYLKKNTQYQYKISALGANGKEFWWSPTQLMTNLQSM